VAGNIGAPPAAAARNRGLWRPRVFTIRISTRALLQALVFAIVLYQVRVRIHRSRTAGAGQRARPSGGMGLPAGQGWLRSRVHSGNTELQTAWARAGVFGADGRDIENCRESREECWGGAEADTMFRTSNSGADTFRDGDSKPFQC
jgi:hypothetical protein